jgi:hypothetical protein
MAFASPSERSCERWNRLALVPPLVGLGSLPPIYLPRVNSGEPKLPSDRRRQAPIPVPPSWFRTTSTAFSAWELRVCCTPQPAKGSPRFAHAGRVEARRPARCRGRSPRCVSHPSKSSPRQQPDTHHCGRCLPVVTVLPGGWPAETGLRRPHPHRSGGRTSASSPPGRATAPKSRGGSPGATWGRRRSEERWEAVHAGGWVVPAVPGRGRAAAPKSRDPRPGGKREGGAPKSPVAGSRGRTPEFRRTSAAWPRGDSEEPSPTGPVGVGPTARRPGARLDGGCPLPRVGWYRRSRDRASGLRRASAAMPGITGVRARRLGRGARKRSRCDDAPIRRSGPPHHRTHAACGAEAPS